MVAMVSVSWVAGHVMTKVVIGVSATTGWATVSAMSVVVVQSGGGWRR